MKTGEIVQVENAETIALKRIAEALERIADYYERNDETYQFYLNWKKDEPRTKMPEYAEWKDAYDKIADCLWK